jgi:hypothetical protein
MQDTASTTTQVTGTAQPDDKGEFVKVEGNEPERTSAEASVVVAYLLMLAIMVLFLWRTLRGLSAFDAEVDNLKRVIREGKA